MLEEKKEKKKNNYIKNIIIICVIMAIAVFVLKIAPNYIVEPNDLNLVINYSNVSKNLKGKAFIDDNGVIYLSKEDIKNFYDEYIYYDEKYNQIITSSDSKIATMIVGQKEKTVNGKTSPMNGEVKEIDGKYYIPFSELEEVYNVKATYIKESNTIVLDSLNRELEIANSKKKNKVKYKDSIFSKTIDEIDEGEEVYIVPSNSTKSETKINNGFIKVRTKEGKLGYIKEDSISDKIIAREEQKEYKQIDGKVSLVWEYFSEYGQAPDRSGTNIEGVNVVSPTFFYLEKLGKGNLLENVGESGKQYINWAHSNGYKVWPVVSNNSMKETTSEIMRDYKLRQSLINQIVEYVKEYDLDGVNIDFEYMKQEDRDLFSRFMIELSPRIKELGKVVSIDVTAPDGSPDWSLCFDRKVLSDVSDYMMFMAYDQHGVSSDEEGTVAGYDWVEANVKKLLDEEKAEYVSNEKLVLGIPFYTRLWKEEDGKITSSVVTMKNVEKSIPEGVTKEWDDTLKQNYIEYQKDGATYKMWIEDEQSIKEKLDLVDKYNLAGASYWVKDYEQSNIWNVINEKLNNE